MAGSHKARHLMSIALHLEVADRVGLTRGPAPRLAIASCGNAAAAAAVIARAAGRELDVFVPESVGPARLARLRAPGVRIEACPRRPGVRGDPAYARLRQAVREGALPFTCQGDLNGLAVEGGETLGWEMADAFLAEGAALDRVVVQVGGGVLASAIVQSFREAAELGALARPPRVDTVQTEAASPLARAAERLAARVAGGDSPRDALAYAVRHRSEFMWPWEEVGASVAEGILDDEVYDWVALLEGMQATGGRVVVVDEVRLREANRLGTAAAGIDADETGTAGLAGLMALVREGAVDPSEKVAVLFTGARREGGAGAP